MKWIFALIFTTQMICCPLFAFTKADQGVEVGHVAPTWKYIPGTDGNLHASSKIQSAEVCVVVFLCNKCPCSRGYEQRLDQLAKDFQSDGVKVIAVNANQGPMENLATMTSRTQGAAFTYLRDAQQQLAKEFGARSTPHAFVMNRHWKVVYSGAFDDDKSAKKVTQPYVRLVVNAVLDGTAVPVAETKSIGCAITFR